MAGKCNLVILVATDRSNGGDVLLLMDLHEALRARSGSVEKLLGLVLCKAGHHLIPHLVFVLFNRGILRSPLIRCNYSTTFYSLILLIEFADLIFIHILLLAPRILITDTLLRSFHTVCLADDIGPREEATVTDGHG